MNHNDLSTLVHIYYKIPYSYQTSFISIIKKEGEKNSPYYIS